MIDVSCPVRSGVLAVFWTFTTSVTAPPRSFTDIMGVTAVAAGTIDVVPLKKLRKSAKKLASEKPRS